VFCIYTLEAQAQDDFILKDAEICPGETVHFNDLIVSTPTIQAFNGWYVNGTLVFSSLLGFTATPVQTTVYTLSYINMDGISTEQSLTVTVYETPVITVPPDQDNCTGNSITLAASVNNPFPTTEIWWDYMGNVLANNSSQILMNLGISIFTAKARNHPNCPTVEKVVRINALINPKKANCIQASAIKVCPNKTVDLNNYIGFVVEDDYLNVATATSHTGNVQWYTDGGTPIGPTVLLNSASDTTFYADPQGVIVTYSNSCNQNFSMTLGPDRIPIVIPIAQDFLVWNSNNPNFGEKIDVSIFLIGENYGLSTCDEITTYQITKGPAPINVTKYTPTWWDMEFPPYTSITDTIEIFITTKLGKTEIIQLTPRIPAEPTIYTEPVCKGMDAYFDIIIDVYDTIRKLELFHLEYNGTDYDTTMTKIGHNYWRIHVPALQDTVRFQWKVTYFSTLFQTDTTSQKNGELAIYNEKPTYFMGIGSEFLDFTAFPNVCLGDSLYIEFYTPNLCDTIKSVTWTGIAAEQDDTAYYAHTYIISPNTEGTHSFSATLNYRQPLATIDSTITFHYLIEVKERPKIFMNGLPADTTNLCYETDGAINLGNRPDIIDYNNFVDAGSAYFINNPNPFQPTSTDNYRIAASYQYTCSEMNTVYDEGVLHVVVTHTGTGGYIIAPPSEGYCVVDGVTITSTNIEGTSLVWSYNGNPVTFPYFLPPGSHTLTTAIYNACYTSGTIANVDVLVIDVPSVTAMNDTSACLGNSINLEVLPGYVGTLAWDVPSPVTINQTATFTVSATTICGTVYDDVTIFLLPNASVITMPDTSVCCNEVITLRTIQKEGTIRWSDKYQTFPDEYPQVQITEDGVFKVVASNTCGEDSAFLKVTMLLLPYVELPSDTTVCYGAIYNYTVTHSTGTLTWSPDDISAITQPVTFKVTATTDKCGSYSDTTRVDTYPQLDFRFEGNIPPYKRNRAYELVFEALNAEPPVEYSIKGTLPPGLTFSGRRISGTPHLGPNDYNTHRLHIYATDNHNCVVSREVKIAPQWTTVTAIMPLGNDYDNAVFLPDFNLEIYNRNGAVIHKGQGWDGKSNNSLVPADTYFYKVKVIVDGVEKDQTGYITVMYN
jgi:hypothetical protein